MKDLSTMPDLHTAEALGLTAEEYDMILEIMGRQPNFTELSSFSVMWSEHCSYKNSIKLLKTLPRDGDKLLVSAGEENAGLVDIGDGWACAFKMESHNHPSAIEPYQGAATGVGGICRDIFTMGARPVAAFNSLRFGIPDTDRMKYLVKGVVAGIGGYGNSLGVPTVGGEMYFESSYQQNILVNAMVAGLVRHGNTISATADGPGNPVFIVGAETGRDGIHGATFASADLTEESVSEIPAVQVGDPYLEKLLLEACLEAIATGALIGMQDMGAAGIINSSSEMAAKSETGMIIDLDKVPARNANMKAYELLLSESQERMLLVVKKGREQEVLDIFDKWDISCVQIGEVTADKQLKFYQNGELVADLEASALVLGGGAPVYTRETAVPAYMKQIEAFNQSDVKEETDIKKIAEFLTAHPTIASKGWATKRFDSTVLGVNTSFNKKSDGSVIRIIDSNKAIVMSSDCNSAYVYADPYKGAMIAVCEAARNVACTGATPMAITNCLNFGNPYNPEVYYQFAEAIRGIGDACRKLDTPVTGGNVSFYNQSVTEQGNIPIYPTPTIGMLGILEDVEKQMTLNFKDNGDQIFLLGPIKEDIGSSAYLRYYHDIEHSPAPDFDLDTESRIHRLIIQLIEENNVQSVHDLSDGGLFVSLIESAIAGNKGFDVSQHIDMRKDAFYFGESQSRILVSTNEYQSSKLKRAAEEAGIDVLYLGKVKNSEVIIDGESFGDVQEWSDIYCNSLENIIEN